MRDQSSKLSQTVGSPNVGELLHKGGSTVLVSALVVNKVIKLNKG